MHEALSENGVQGTQGTVVHLGLGFDSVVKTPGNSDTMVRLCDYRVLWLGAPRVLHEYGNVAIF